MSWCKVLKKKGVFFTQKKIYAKTCRKCTKQRHHEEQETNQWKKKWTQWRSQILNRQRELYKDTHTINFVIKKALKWYPSQKHRYEICFKIMCKMYYTAPWCWAKKTKAWQTNSRDDDRNFLMGIQKQKTTHILL